MCLVLGGQLTDEEAERGVNGETNGREATIKKLTKGCSDGKEKE